MKNIWMTFSLVLSILFLIPQSVISQPQRSNPSITCQANDIPLREILNDITEQAGIQFVYYDALVDGRLTSCRFSDASLEDALHSVLTPVELAWKRVGDVSVVVYRKPKNPAPLSSIIDRQIETVPRLKYELEPDYPRLAKMNELEGEVGLNYHVTPEGKVDEVLLLQSSGYPILDAAAKSYVRRLEFEPALQGDVPVDAWLALRLEFELSSSKIDDEEYLERVAELRERLEAVDAQNQRPLLQELMELHVRFISNCTMRHNENNNAVIQSVLSSETYAKWKDVWQDWPMQFLILHDFLNRYPEAQALEVQQTLIQYLRTYVTECRRACVQMKPEDKSHFMNRVYAFLMEEYPQAISEELRKEVGAIR